MKNKLNGYDIDGVLASGIKPEKPYIVISGRSRYWWDSMKEKVGLDAPIYLDPMMDKEYSKERSYYWKTLVINRAGVTTFYEDDEVQAKFIRENCPNCKVIIIKK